MNWTRVLTLALASLTLPASMPQEAEQAPDSEERQAETGAGPSDPQAIGCPPKGIVWIVLATLPLALVVMPIYGVVKLVSWFFKKKPKRSRSKTESTPPRKVELGPPPPEHMTRLTQPEWRVA